MAATPEQKLSTWDHARRSGQKKQRRRVLRWVVLGVVVVVVGGVALAPTIVGAVTPSVLSGQSAIAGTLRVQRAGFAWLRQQKITGLELLDPSGASVASLDITAERSLLDLATSGGKVGKVRVSGSLDVVRNADGSLNVISATTPTALASPAPASPASTGPASLPPQLLGATLEITKLAISYTDLVPPAPGSVAVGVVRLSDLKGEVSIDQAGVLSVRLGTPVTATAAGSAAGSAGNAAGAFDTDVTITGLVKPDGTLDLDGAVIKGDVTAADLALTTLASIGLLDAKLAEALGGTMRVSATLAGTPAKLDATLAVRSGTIDIAAPIGYDRDAARVYAREAITARVAARPFIDMAATGDSLVISGSPMLTATVNTLSVPLPGAGGLDLRTLAADVAVGLEAWSAELAVPGNGGAVVKRRVDFAPSAVVIRAETLASGVSVNADTALTIDGAPGGTISADVRADGLLDDAGAPLGGGQLPRVNGSITAADVALAAFQPFLEASGVNLARDLGERGTLTVTAAPGAAAGATVITLEGGAANGSLRGGMTLSGSTLALNEGGLTATLQRVGPLLDAMAAGGDAAAAPMRVREAGPLTLRVPVASVDLARLGAGDLRGASARVGVELGEVRGESTPPQGARQAFVVRGLMADADVSDMASGVGLTAAGRAEVDGRPAGVLAADIRVAGFLDGDGKATGGLPSSITGNATMMGVATALLQPFLEGTGVVLARDVGETADLGLTTSVQADAGAAAGSIPPTALTATLNSARLTIDAPLMVDGASVRTTDRPITLTHTAPAGLLGGVLAAAFKDGATPAPQVSAAGASGLTANITMNVPLDRATRAPKVDGAMLRASAALTGVTVAGGGERLGLESLALTAILDPGAAPEVGFDLAAESGGPVTGQGRFKLVNGLKDGATPQLDGGFTVTGLPAALAGLVAAPVQTPSGQTATIAELAGLIGAGRVDLSATAAPQGASDTALTFTAKGQGLDVSTGATLALNDPASARAWSADASATVAPASLDRALALFAPDVTPRPRLRGAATATLKAARAGDRVTASATLPSAAFERMQLPGQPGAGLGPILGPLGVAFGASAEGSAAALLEQGAGDVTFSLTASAKEDAGASLGDVKVNGTAAMAGGKPAGRVTAKAEVSNLSTALADTLAAQPGLVSGAVGATASMTAEVTADMDSAGAPKSLEATASVSAPRLRTQRPIAVAMRNNALMLQGATEIGWDADPAWINARLAPAGGGTPRATITSLLGARVNLDQLSVPMGENSGAPLALAVSLKADEISARFADGQTATYNRLLLSGKTTGTPGTVELLGELLGPGGTRTLDLTGSIRELVGPDGSINAAGAVTTLSAKLTALPTTLLEALAGSNADLPGILGASVDATADLVNFPREGGSIAFTTTTPKANAQFKAVVTDPAGDDRLFLVAEGTPRAEVRELSQAFKYNPVRFLPIIGGLEKSASDQDPAEVTISTLSVPMDGNVRDIALDATVDPGQVSFAVDGALSQLLKAIGQNSQGEAGNRIEPVRVSMNRDGVMRVDNLKIPAGEFVFQGSGTVNLNESGPGAQTQRFRVLIPAGAFVGEVFGPMNALGGGVLNEAILVPVYAEGPLGGKMSYRPAPQEVASELFKSAAPKLIEDLIKKGIGDNLPKIPGLPGGKP